MSTWSSIFKELNESKVDVYPPATKQGECIAPYTVVKQDGSAQAGTFSSEYVYYQFMLYVPQNAYDKLDAYEKEVKEILAKKLHPWLMPTGSNMPDYYDDTIKAHMRSFVYRNNVRNEHL